MDLEALNHRQNLLFGLLLLDLPLTPPEESLMCFIDHSTCRDTCIGFIITLLMAFSFCLVGIDGLPNIPQDFEYMHLVGVH